MPISVYLDTQHISRAALNKNNVRALLADPNLSFYFSVTHVLESLPKSLAENQQSVDRLSLIMNSLSRGLVGWGRVTELEKQRGKLALDSLTCDVKNMLFPALAIDRARWMRKVREGLKSLIADQISDQNLRRSFQSKVLRHGRLTPAAFAYLRAEVLKTTERVNASLPQAAPLLEPGGIYDFLEGKVSEKAFTNTFRDSIADPVKLAEMVTNPEMGSVLDLSQVLWTQMDAIRETISKLVTRLTQSQVGLGVCAYPTIRRLALDNFKSDEFRAGTIYRFSGVKVEAGLLAVMPGSRLLVDVFGQYVLEKIDTFANPQSNAFGKLPTFKRSDAADFVHLVYQPYVDVFCCDSGMRDRIKRAGWPVSDVATNDAELEAAIRKKSAS